MVTRIVNVLESIKASRQFKEDVKGLADRFRGHGLARKRLEDDSLDPHSVSKSHQSYVKREDSFRQFVTLLGSEPLYNPNEVDLKVTSLQVVSDQFKVHNDSVGVILAPVEVARITRNKLLYAVEDGVVDVALRSKHYLKGAAGSMSAEYGMVKGIRFTRPM
jgi:hypothetical protein